MVIAVNTRLLIPGKLDGIGWFTFETLKRITADHPEHHFLFLFDRKVPQDFIFSPNIEPVILFPPARHPILWHWWLEHSVRKVLEYRKPGLFLSPDGFICLSSRIPSLPVIHDINFHHRPGDLPFASGIYYRKQFPKFATRAKRIATVSMFSKQDISRTYGIDPDRIDVVYNGVGGGFGPVTEEEKQKTRAVWSQGEPYFVFVGSLHPRKNLCNLLLAFDEFRKTQPTGIRLVIAGEALFKARRLQSVLRNMQFGEEVVFAGRQQPEGLRLIVGSALSLVLVSFYEGFGIPILEAMHCDIPVITSNITSMPEVGGDACLYANPHSVDSIRDALLQMAGDPDLRSDLVSKGRIQRGKFSWDRTAEKLWDSMMACLE